MTDDRTEDGILRMRMRHWLLKHCTKGEGKPKRSSGFGCRGAGLVRRELAPYATSGNTELASRRLLTTPSKPRCSATRSSARPSSNGSDNETAGQPKRSNRARRTSLRAPTCRRWALPWR
jgi:hypothetical protein